MCCNSKKEFSLKKELYLATVDLPNSPLKYYTRALNHPMETNGFLNSVPAFSEVLFLVNICLVLSQRSVYGMCYSVFCE
jgi:hypothetical protein